MCSLLWLLPPTSVAQPPAPAAPPALLTAPAPTVASDVQLWTLPDSQCQVLQENTCPVLATCAACTV